MIDRRHRDVASGCEREVWTDLDISGDVPIDVENVR
jgi:hypothetical protein